MNGAIRPAGPPRAPGAAAFAGNRLQWRRLLAEGGGTFFLVLVTRLLHRCLSVLVARSPALVMTGFLSCWR